MMTAAVLRMLAAQAGAWHTKVPGKQDLMLLL